MMVLKLVILFVSDPNEPKHDQSSIIHRGVPLSNQAPP